ncbi:MAG: Uma2 family endonuclease [Planctomycetales bacterium]|nr:Uma2 family endonuclease [Planctomycetales bacterium]
MSAAPKYRPRYTVDDYSTWEGDWELWDGLAVAMSPSPLGVHQLVLFNLAGELRAQLRDQGCRTVVFGKIDWIVSRETVVRPDVVVLCGDVPDKHIETAPAIVAEILSASTAERDRTFKRDLYDKQGAQAYLVVDPESKTMLAYRRDDGGKWNGESVTDSITLAVCENCSATIQLANLF